MAVGISYYWEVPGLSFIKDGHGNMFIRKKRNFSSKEVYGSIGLFSFTVF
jgi:hypothetical protein